MKRSNFLSLFVLFLIALILAAFALPAHANDRENYGVTKLHLGHGSTGVYLTSSNGTVFLDNNNRFDSPISIGDFDPQSNLSQSNSVGSVANSLGALHYDVFTFTNVQETFTDGSAEGESQVLAVFPEGRILILSAAINATVTNTLGWEASANDVYNVAIGTAAASDADDLTSTEADIIGSTSLDTVSNTDASHEWEADMTAGADTVFDGTSTAVALYFNAGATDASQAFGTNNTIGVSGTLGVAWVFLGDD